MQNNHVQERLQLRVAGMPPIYKHNRDRAAVLAVTASEQLVMSKRCQSSASNEQQAKRRKVKYATYNGWVTQNDHDYQTVTWLDCEMRVEDGTKVVTQLKCRMCTKFKERIA